MALAILAALAVGFVPAQAQAETCDRACLGKTLDTYLAALVAHKPDAAGLSLAFRQTENAVPTTHGKGLWQAATGLGPLQRSYFDTTTGTAAYFGTIDTAEGTIIASLRLHRAADGVDEAEWHIAKPDTDVRVTPDARPMFDLAMLLSHPPAERVVPVAERLPRHVLVAIANSYFDGITAEDASLIRAHDGCTRLENGIGAPPGVKNDEGTGPPDCMDGQGRFDVSIVAGRRYPVVDEEAQVVLAIGTFMRKPGNPKLRNQFSEFFYIDHGKIRDIYAAYFYAPPGRAVPNWPPYEGNFQIPAAAK
jgi:hypothetical protein